MSSRSIAIKNKTRRRKAGESTGFLPEAVKAFARERLHDSAGLATIGVAGLLGAALASYHAGDPSLNTAAAAETQNLMGAPGAWLSDILLQTLGLAAWVLPAVMTSWGWRVFRRLPIEFVSLRVAVLPVAALLLAASFARVPAYESWPLGSYLGGSAGAMIFNAVAGGVQSLTGLAWHGFYAFIIGLFALTALAVASGVTRAEWINAFDTTREGGAAFIGFAQQLRERFFSDEDVAAPRRRMIRSVETDEGEEPDEEADTPALKAPKIQKKPAVKSKKSREKKQPRLALLGGGDSEWQLPPLELLQEPAAQDRAGRLDESALQRNAELLQSVLGDYGVKGDILSVSPGPVITLYELEPAPGTKSSRVIGLSDDIARSMSAVSVRAAVIPGRNAIGIELPNARRETVFLRELLSASEYERTTARLPLVLGKNIAGEPIIADLARMPHLLVAGTTGSGKSVAINTMILSLLYRLPPEKCRFIMIDPKMLELSVYDDIPHLLSPVVTEPEKAIVALKWTVREMEDRYRAMSKLGVRNIEGYNARLKEAREKGEVLMRKVQTGFDAETGKPVFEDQPLDLTELPYIVVVVDEFADLMIVAGKDVEAAIQRLAQMARAAGIHLIMATQRPSVDVITGTIKANFPTRISFQVTSRIDSRTILGDGGAEQLLGQGDMLYMAAGGRIMRVHGPFVDDREVEQVSNFLRDQGEPDYLEDVTEGEGLSGMDGVSGIAGGVGSGDDLYDQAVALVIRERKASTSFIQRYLQIGYNRAARIIEQMEKEGLVGPPNHVGKREIYAGE